MERPSRYSAEFRQRAVRLLVEQRDEYASEFEAIRSVTTKLGTDSPETFRQRLGRAEINEGARLG